MRVVPEDIRQADASTLAIRWSDGVESRLPVRDLRIGCPCAGCRDELTGDRILDPDSVPKDVKPVELASVGNYAIRITWSDGHDTGLYTFERLRELAP